MKTSEKSSEGNLILNHLPERMTDEIRPHLKQIEMPLGEVLYRPREKIEYIYFPETSVVSLVTCLENGDSVEAGIVGKEGVVGAAIIFADGISHTEAATQLGGSGQRMRVSDFKNCFNDSREFRDAVLYHIYSYIVQISQNSACLCYHTIEKRFARCLLMFADRANRETLVLTQQFIAQMLGVKRPSVSVNAARLQRMQLIKYNRGTIRILDRKALQNLACECYREISLSLGGFSE
ncbi:MAG: Crp/Fnr family transcriptional regulator [Pyrinomonadaceae bacterium]